MVYIFNIKSYLHKKMILNIKYKSQQEKDNIMAHLVNIIYFILVNVLRAFENKKKKPLNTLIPLLFK